MAGPAGLMAAAPWLPTSAGGARQRTRAKIDELSDLLRNLLAALLEIGKGKGHVWASLFLATIYARNLTKQKSAASGHFCVAHPAAPAEMKASQRSG